MLNKHLVATIVIALILTVLSAQFMMAQTMEVLQPAPLDGAVKGVLQPVKPGSIEIPGILWGGEAEYVTAMQNNYFTAEGLDVRIVLNNDLTSQVQNIIDGKTPFIRGDVGMVVVAADALAKYNVGISVFHKLTWSVDGDMIVFRQGKNLSNCRKVALQLYGPHMRFAATVFKDKGRLDQIKFVYFRNITPTNTGGLADDGVTAFIKDQTFDAVFCVYNDAMNLTSGGKVGDGGVGSVKGAYIGATSKSFSRIIGDVIGVRSDWAAQSENAEILQKLSHALLRAQEDVMDLYKNRETEKSRYNDLLKRTAQFIEVAPGDVDGLLSGCQFDGYDGNVKFLTGNSSVSLKGIVAEVTPIFRKMNLVSARQILVTPASLNFQALASGLKYVTASSLPSNVVNVLDREGVTRKIESRKTTTSAQTMSGNTEPESDWSEEVFSFTINFDANVTDFSASVYEREFTKAKEYAQKYGGSMLLFEGHADIRGVNQAKEKGLPPAMIANMERQLKNTSQQRAENASQNFIEFCRRSGVVIDKSQCFSTGYGVERLIIKNPVDKADSKVNQRVVFRIIPVEAVN